MSLFQKSVEQKYLNELDSKQLEIKYNEFKSYFGNPEIQENIRNSKEEQFQEGFLRELFVKILGYTLNPTPQYNLTTELKNITNSKKADGAVLRDDYALAVIELKSTATTDLDTVEAQAFGYKNHNPKCVYVITSNFEKLRFYIQNAVDNIEFDLFRLTKEQFSLLWLCLAKDNLLNDLPLQIKNASVLQEENITKKLYTDYSKFKNALFDSLVKNNPDKDKLLLYRKTQKLLDRFLFIFFAEDRQLLPPNSINDIIKQWESLKNELDAYVPLYERFKKYFGYLNTGHKGKNFDIYPYNGGLFAPDDLLDTISIDDALLHEHTVKLSSYDFSSEVDVNILGHIFEHSLNDIENVQAEIKGEEIDRQKTKRKKDGIFYTPKYITKYIVENTVGKLCAEKRQEFGIDGVDYEEKKRKDVKRKHLEKLDAYRDWLKTITILDPACGSGAFLNQALDFLIEEHKKIDELKAQLLGASLVFSDIETDILEHNIFGVDLNEESVEIAKLSLWLRTARKGRKLNTLSNNIKCGNSLIDDPAIAGNKAFNWQKEFPEVFKKKEKKAWHITTATHNSRYSQRMFDNHVKLGDPVWLSPEEEVIITKTVDEIVEKDKLNILAYNICGDHMHLLLVCEEQEVPKIIGKIKSMSARACNIAMGRTIPIVPSTRGHAPLSTSIPQTSPLSEEKEKGETQAHLWTQKFGQKEITSDEQLHNTIVYIRNNRIKHQLPPLGEDINKGACPLVIEEKRVSLPLEDSTGYTKGACPLVACPLVDIENICCSIDHAFRTEYTGGFDIIVGNPPYVFARDNFQQIEKDFYVVNYASAKYQINTYLLFIEKSVILLKSKGVFGLIIPNSWLMVYSGEGLRRYLLDSCKLNQIINLEGYSFESANVETVILISEKESIIEDNNFDVLLNNGNEFYFSHSKNQRDFLSNKGYEFKVFLDDESDELNNKIVLKTEILDNLVQIKAGLQAYEKDKGEPKQSAEDVINRPYDYDYKYDDDTFKYLDGKDVGRYLTNWSGLYLRYGKHLAAPRTFDLFNGKKIIVREITGNFPHCLISVYSEDVYLFNRSNIAIIEKEGSEISLKYITAILNSTLISYYFLKNTAKSVRKLFPKIILNDLRKFPIKNIALNEQQPFVEKADLMLSFNKDLQDLSQKFQRTIQRKFNLEELSTKLQDWHTLSFKDFIAELGKKKIKLSLSEEAEWEDYFMQEQKKALELKAKIDATDKEIDQMVYKLYELTDEEIKIVEG